MQSEEVVRSAKGKRQKMEASSDRTEDGNTVTREVESQVKLDDQCMLPQEDPLVNWMRMDEPESLQNERFRDGDTAIECDDTDDSDDVDQNFGEEDGADINHRDKETNGNPRPANQLQASDADSQRKSKLLHAQTDLDRNETRKFAECNAPEKTLISVKEVRCKGPESVSLHKKPLKVAFCPKEVKTIMELDDLLLKNAESHTIRKIIVFASLGIRQGCEDMYELDINHFRIVRKGEPHVSHKNPGEHVLYDNPGVRRKIFYPNKHNPTLCPVQILNEEKGMRPSDASCPSYLFLCIKYSGRTRNLPQNEYVRQRMGRNKMKSFGNVICRMALMVHIRSGSFFFKALGITLLFMAGFPDYVVQRETKYRNLDLLQKYYRTDADAEGEDLFLPHIVTCDTGHQQLAGKVMSTKTKGKKQANAVHKPQNAERSKIQQSLPSSTLSSDKFGLMGYTSVLDHSMAQFQSIPSQSPADILQISSTAIPNSGTQTTYPMFPPQPPNAFIPLVYWPAHPYLSAFGYRSFPFTGNYTSIHPQPYYYTKPSSNSIIPQMAEGKRKADSKSNSSSSSSEPKEHSNSMLQCKQ